MGFIRPTSGEAVINGVDVVADPLGARRHAAYLAESVMLYEGMTARQNIEFFCELCGQRRPGGDRCVALLERVGLAPDALDRRVRELSKGMRQKLGLAICLGKGCVAFILDEPMSGLDPEAAQQMMEVLDSLRAEGRAVLMSTHDVFRARELASRVGILKDGRALKVIEGRDLQGVDLSELYLDLMRGCRRSSSDTGWATGSSTVGAA
jgi:ABC-2 type transport system ATP-binding protein